MPRVVRSGGSLLEGRRRLLVHRVCAGRRIAENSHHELNNMALLVAGEGRDRERERDDRGRGRDDRGGRDRDRDRDR